MSRVAALYVDPNGVYSGLDGVDLWDEQRDARLYAGPWPVVAHPPCARWCQLASVNEARWGARIGDDGGCFAAALKAVERWGGVLEHPAYSIAWSRFGLPRPARYGWARNFERPATPPKSHRSRTGTPRANGRGCITWGRSRPRLSGLTGVGSASSVQGFTAGRRQGAAGSPRPRRSIRPLRSVTCCSRWPAAPGGWPRDRAADQPCRRARPARGAAAVTRRHDLGCALWNIPLPRPVLWRLRMWVLLPLMRWRLP